MKKILFPTDFSDIANNAYVHALELAKVVKAELILLHTFEIPIINNEYYPENYQDLFDSLELSKFEKFKDEIPKLRAIAEERKLEHIPISHRLMEGDLISNIKDCIEADKIDFVVMGTSGRTGWTDFFFGTVTGDVLHTVSVPVLSVPINAKYNKLEKIGFTTRFREKDKVALQEVLTFAKKTNAKVHCLYVKTRYSDISNEKIAEWEKEFEHEPVMFFVLPNDEVKESIIEFIDHQDIDVLAMKTYKKSFFVDLFTSSFTENMSKSIDIPVLVLHE